MVLQRDADIKIWGWADPREAITLTFRNKKYKTRADEQGNWQLTLPSQAAGGPFDMQFKGNNELQVKDILFGDVWICSGQSNMVLPMERVKEKYPQEIAAANYPQIRNFFIPTRTSLTGPQADLPPGSWKSANPQDVLQFSAAAYFFARSVYEQQHIPIGLINASVGGTPIEAWISEAGLKNFPDLSRRLEKNKDEAYIDSLRRATPPPAPPRAADLGLQEAVKWFDPAYEPKDWQRINIPGYWEDQGIKELNGVVWYRKEIDVPADMMGVEAKLFMGRIVDADFIYVNGQQVGNITYQYPPRRYNIPAGVLKAGKNTITIRVLNYQGKGGFVPDKPYYLTANGRSIDLKGDWLYKVGDVFPPASGGGGPRLVAQNQPSALYNAMVAPLTRQAVKGFLWYQGETNSGNPTPYRLYLPALIRDWRQLWGQGDLPFLYVQLANFMDVDYLPAESNWAELRDAQLQALSEPNTAMTVAIDLGEWNDIHPLNKKDVGERLALGALHLAYGAKDLVYSGPIYESYSVEGNKMTIRFKHTGSGLISKDGTPLRRFEIAGPDGEFSWAEARIEGDQVVIWNDDIEHPWYARYAWANNPADANLYNQEGLPASPFRTRNPDKVDDLAWRGRQCAVVLTYDDALNVHLDNAISLLDSLHMKGTFYLTSFAPGFKNRIADWRAAAQRGHELGNHMLFHPCMGNLPGREWVSDDYDMSTYSLRRMLDEVRMNNVLLETLDGQKRRTFAYTCGDREIGGEPFMPQLQADFIAARSVRHEMHQLGQIDLYDVDCYAINGQSGAEMIQLVKQAMASNSLLVFLFHGVGGEHALNVSLPAHRELLQFLKENEHQVWVTTMLEAADHIRVRQNAPLEDGR